MRNIGTVASRENILNALHGGYYKENNKYYTFYKSQWYESEIIDDVFMDIFCPVDAMIFYTIKLRRDYFWAYQSFYKIRGSWKKLIS